MPRVRIVLASKSPARLAVLRNAGIEPEVVVSGVDEDAITADTPVALVQALATAKARAVLERLEAAPPESAPAASSLKARAALERLEVGPAGRDQPASVSLVASEPPDGAPGANPETTVVIGCDSLFEFEGEVFGKPGTPERARERCRRVSGRSGLLHTGHTVVVLRGGRRLAAEAVATTKVVFGTLSDAEIDAYLATGEPLHVAGGFTIDGYGGAFVESLEGDHTNVIGLSLPLLRRLLAELGVAYTDLWQR
ncbi:MAG: Maf family nucleotide pyrophosphatase [Propionibacteriaceae bacterium]|jgi:septum formation protein|nr:Maf family nucleotide pyrophosphatase [Propionibacteriaceae bacterium]